MRKSVLVLLLVTTILVAHAEAGWFRKVVDKVKKVVNKVKDFVKKVKPYVPILGKRSVDYLRSRAKREQPVQPQEESDYLETMQQLNEACLTFGITRDMSLDPKTIMDIFNSVDEDGDRSINEEELGTFEDITDVMEYCMMRSKEKQLEGLSGPVVR